MPITVPAIDSRKFEELRAEALRRIPVHNPEWTNFNSSDPGVTLIEVFAFLTESLLYRANQIPERNRSKFLELLGIPLRSASAAEGVVTIANERGPLETVTLPTGLELLAGQVTFRTEQGFDVLPVEGHVFHKRELKNPPPALRAYYDQLFASFLHTPAAATARLYESLPLSGGNPVDLADDTVDGSLWVALVARRTDTTTVPPDQVGRVLDRVRGELAGKTLTLGVVPWLADPTRKLSPTGVADPATAVPLACHIPAVPASGLLPTTPSERIPKYRALPVIGDDVWTRPGTVQVTLPDKDGLRRWENLDPLEAGVGDFPPAIDDTNLEARVVTWLRFSVPARARASVLWAGINATRVAQRAHVIGERLPEGTGAPEQSAKLSRSPVLAGSVRVRVTRPGGEVEEWEAVSDLGDAGPEVPVRDPRLPPGGWSPKPAPSRVFVLDAEAGAIRFGDGVRGARPPLGAEIVADYDFSEGREGNVNTGAIMTGPNLPAGFAASNPVATWGGADAESVAEGEKQVQRWLQHRDRLVSAADFESITWRTPGVEIGRVEVIPAASPELGANEPGDAPGAVTLLVIPRSDPDQPDAPRPDRLFLEAICEWIDPRRLVTTEVFLRGPEYRKIWLSVAIDVAAQRSVAEVRRAVEGALRSALAPIDPAYAGGTEGLLPVFQAQEGARRGWPLRKPVVALELAAVAARVPGVTAVRDLQLAGETDTTGRGTIEIKGLELPRLAGIMVSVGALAPVAELRESSGTGGPATGDETGFLPVPVVPEEC